MQASSSRNSLTFSLAYFDLLISLGIIRVTDCSNRTFLKLLNRFNMEDLGGVLPWQFTTVAESEMQSDRVTYRDTKNT